MNRWALFLMTVLLAQIAVLRCLSAGEEHHDASAIAETVASELALAEAARQQAADARAEWLQTGALIEQARGAAEKEDWQQALALAREARRQGELAVGQAERESLAWRERVIR